MHQPHSRCLASALTAKQATSGKWEYPGRSNRGGPGSDSVQRRSGGVLALCREVRRTPNDGLVYLSNCLFSDPEDLARGSQAGPKCISRPDLAENKLS